MTERPLRLALAVLVAILAPRPGAAQTPVSAKEAAAAPAPSAPPWFVYMRYGYHSAEYAFAAYSFGRPSVMAGIVSDAEGAYDEVQGGAGINLYSASGNGAALYAMGSMATDSWYAVFYVLPNVTRGRLNVTAFAGSYVPLERKGVRQAFADPVTALWRVHQRLALGGSYSTYAIEGVGAKSSAGPSVQVAVPNGSLTADVMRPVANARAELRLTLQLAF